MDIKTAILLKVLAFHDPFFRVRKIYPINVIPKITDPVIVKSKKVNKPYFRQKEMY